MVQADPQLDTQQKENEITLKELLLQLQEWWRYILKKWLIIAICGILGGTLGLLYSLTKKMMYTAELSFVLEETKSNSLGNYSSLASQLGINLGGVGESGMFSGDNIMLFLKSRLMIEKTLLSPVMIDGKQQTLAELYINVVKMRDAWKDKPELQKVAFGINSDRTKFSRAQDSVLNGIFETIVKDHLEIDKTDKRYSFISVKCTSLNETFSKAFVEILVKEASSFYVETKTKRSKENVDKLQKQADSLEILLNRKTYSAAASQDLNLNPARNLAGVNTEMITRDKVILQTMYGEVVKNLEISKMAMLQETPLIQIVDAPILPLKKEKFRKLKGIAIGGILFGFLAVVYLICKKLVRQIMEG